MIQLKKKRLDLGSLFATYLEECSKIKYSSSPYCYDGYYGDDYDDWYNEWYGGGFDNYAAEYDMNGDLIVYGKKSKKKVTKSVGTKRGKRGSKKSKCIPLYSDNDSIFNESLYSEDEVTIYYYPDVNNMDERKVFFNLHDFSDYLDNMGIYVSSYEVSQILNRSISHCCIDPCYEGSKGEPWLVSDSSIGGLLWSIGAITDSSDYCNSGYYKDDLPF